MKTFFSENLVTIIVVLAIIGALIYSIFYNNGAIINRELKKIEKKKIYDCQTGEYVKVEGQIKYVGTPILAPFSGKPCSYYYVLVEEHRSYSNFDNGGLKVGEKGDIKKPLGRWVTIIEEERGNDLVINDGNSYALIETNMIKSNLKVDKIYLSSTAGNPIEKLEKYLEKHDIKDMNSFGLNKSIRYTEAILQEGDTVVVAGKVAWKRKSELKLEMPIERILVLGANGNTPVYLSNDPKLEWNVAKLPRVGFKSKWRTNN